jgi:hypothetical protein
LPETVFERTIGRNGFAAGRFDAYFGNHHQTVLLCIIIQQVV